MRISSRGVCPCFLAPAHMRDLLPEVACAVLLRQCLVKKSRRRTLKSYAQQQKSLSRDIHPVHGVASPVPYLSVGILVRGPAGIIRKTTWAPPLLDKLSAFSAESRQCLIVSCGSGVEG
jgi:hypothetical protein